MQKIQIILMMLFLILLRIAAQDYMISLNYPFLLTNQKINILAIKAGFNGSIYTIFTDGSVRRYLPDLSSYVIVTYRDKIQSISFVQSSLTGLLPNGISFRSHSLIQITISQNQTVLAFYDNNIVFIQNYSMGDVIIFQSAQSIQYPNSTIVPYGYAVCKNSLYAVLRSQKYMMLNYSSIYGNNVTAIGASQTLIGNLFGGGNAILKLQLCLTLSNKQFISVTLKFNLTFNYTTTSYQYNSISVTRSLITTFPQQIINVQLDQSYYYVIMQAPSLNYYFYDIGLSMLGIVNNSNLNSFQMIQTVDFNWKIYMLTTTGLLRINIDSNSELMTFVSLISPLPLNRNYQIASMLGFDIFYVQNGPYIYKTGSCVGQTITSNNSVCVAYSCSDPNCLLCPINNVTCGTCKNGFVRNQSFLCEANLSSNFSNAIPKIWTTISIILSDQLSLLMQILRKLIIFFEVVISIPGARAMITPIFYLFGNFDDLYLYQFHDREYNSVINDFFNQLNNLQAKKWNLVNSTQLISHFMNFEAFNNFTNFQQQFQQYNYTENTINANQSQGLFANSESYFITIVPIVIAYFCIFHMVFIISSQYFFSKLFRKFYFWAFLSILLFNGNIQQLCFYMIREWSSIFAFNFYQRMYKIGIISFGFILLFVGSAIYYLACFFYKQKVAVIIENKKGNKLGLLQITIQFGLRNIGLSFLQFYGRTLSYYVFTLCLAMSQLLLLVFIAVMISLKAFRECLGVWILFMLSLLRLILIITFMMDYQNLDLNLQYSQLNIILLMIIIFILGIIIQIIRTVFELQGFLKNRVCHYSKIKQFPNPTNIITTQLKEIPQKVKMVTQNVRFIPQSEVSRENIPFESNIEQQKKKHIMRVRC